MKLKSLLTITALTIFTALPVTAMSATTPVKFSKGSTCGSFTGNFAGRNFTLGLGAGQTLTVNAQAYDVIVKDPRGRTLPYQGQDYGEWVTRSKGTHTIKVIPSPTDGSYGTIEFCAY